MDVCFVLWVTIQYYIIYSVAHIAPASAFGSSVSWLLCPFGIPPSMWCLPCFVVYFPPNYKILQALQDSGTTRFSTLTSYISCSSSEINQFCEELLFLLLESSVRNQDLGSGCVPCYWALATNSESCVCVN